MSFIERFDRLTEIVEDNITKPGAEIYEAILEEFLTTRECMGYTFWFIVGYHLPEYIRKRKLCAAYHIKEDTGCTWEAVLEVAGYAERSTFDKAFKREYYTSPAQYLKGEKQSPLVERLNLMDAIMMKEEEHKAGMQDDTSCVNPHQEAVRDLLKQDWHQVKDYMSFQTVFGLSAAQVSLIDSLRLEDVDLFTACDLVQIEYGDLENIEYTSDELDRMYLTINQLCLNQNIESILSTKEINYPLNVRQYDPDYIRTVDAMINELVVQGTPLLTHSIFEKLKRIINPAGKGYFANFCNQVIKDYSLKEIVDIVNDEKNSKDKDIWHVMYHTLGGRKSAEDLVDVLNETSKHAIREMGWTYLTIIDANSKAKMREYAERLTYEHFCKLQDMLFENNIYDDGDIYNFGCWVARSGCFVQKALRLTKNLAIKTAIKDRKKNVSETLHSNYFLMPDLILNVLDKEFADKVPLNITLNGKNEEKIRAILLEAKDAWTPMSFVEEIEFGAIIGSGVPAEECRRIIRKELEREGICEDNMDIEYMLINRYFFALANFSIRKPWDKTLISYSLYKEIKEYAENYSKLPALSKIPILALVAYDMKYTGMSIDQAFDSRFSAF